MIGSASQTAHIYRTADASATKDLADACGRSCFVSFKPPAFLSKQYVVNTQISVLRLCFLSVLHLCEIALRRATARFPNVVSRPKITLQVKR